MTVQVAANQVADCSTAAVPRHKCKPFLQQLSYSFLITVIPLLSFKQFDAAENTNRMMIVTMYRCPTSVASPGFVARRGTKLRENNLRVTHKNIMIYEIHAINGDEGMGPYIFTA